MEASSTSSSSGAVSASSSSGGADGGYPDAGQGDAGQDDGGAPALSRCIPDPVLVASGAGCVSDGDCPCGTHCVLGECLADCTEQAPCGAGNVCDQFGRCRAATDSEIVVTAQPEFEAPWRVWPLLVKVPDVAQAQELRVLTEGTALGAVRVLGDDVVEVQCAPAEPFGRECRAEGVSARSELTVGVRLTRPLAGDELGTVKVYSGSRVEVVSVEGAAYVPPPPPPPQSPPPGADISGVYEGNAQLQYIRGYNWDLGRLEGPTVTRSALANLKAEVHGTSESAVIVLRDESRVMLPTGAWVGSLQRHPLLGYTFLQLPRIRVVEDEVLPGMDVEALLEGWAPLVGVQVATDVTLTATVVLIPSGVLDNPVRPSEVWALALVRSGALPGGATAPPVPAEEAPLHDVTRARQVGPWMETHRAAVTPPDWDAAAAHAAELADSLISGEPRADACGLDEASLLAVSRAATSRLLLRPAQGFTHSQTALGQTTLTLNAPGYLNPSATDGGPLVATVLGALDRLNFSTLSVRMAPGTPLAVDGVAVACAGRLPAGTLTLVGSGFGGPQYDSRSYPEALWDECAALSAATGCTAQALASPRAEPVALSFTASNDDRPGPLAWQPTGPAGIQVTSICVLPRVIPACQESLSCAAPVAGDDASLAGSRFGTVAGSNSGDLACAWGARAAGLDLSTQRDLPDGDARKRPAAALLQECVDELDALRNTVPPVAPAGNDNAARLAAIWSGGTCLDPARLMTLLDLLVDDQNGAPGAPFHPRQAYLQALLSQWLEVHALLAREATEREVLAEIIRRAPGSDAAPATPADLFDRSLRGWLLLLHPRMATAVDRLGTDALRAPDYRQFIGGAGPLRARHTQANALPVAMLETLRVQVELARRLVDTGRSTPSEAVLQHALQVLRYVQLIRPQALLLQQRAVEAATAAGQPVPAWTGKAEEVDAALQRAMGAFLAQVAAHRSGRNPLGIEDEDLPLYFLGDEASAPSRFWAVSDFLIGVGGNTSGWAPDQVADADAALAAARSAWQQREGRTLERALTAQEQAQRELEVRRRYGDQVLSLCGDVAGLASEDILETAGNISGNNCYVRPECSVDAQRYLGRLRTRDVDAQVCMVRKLAALTGNAVRFRSPEMNDIAQATCSSTTFLATGCPEAGGGACYRCFAGFVELVAPIALSTLGDVDISSASVDQITHAKAACEQQYGSVSGLPLDEDSRLPASCYQGSLGETALEVRGLATAVSAARSELAEKTEAYDVAMRSCILLITAQDAKEEANTAYRSSVGILKGIAYVANMTDDALQAVNDCGVAAAGDWNGISLLTCAAAAAQVAVKLTARTADYGVEVATLAHEAVIEQLDNELEAQRCMNDAGMNLVGARSAALRITQARQDLEMALNRFADQRVAVAALMVEGAQELARVRGGSASVMPLAEDFWLSEAVRAFARKMRLAKRVVYLAVRAYEYESQQSLALRSAVLDAAQPSELDAVLDDLRTAVATRRVNGSLPEDFKAVVSLRDQLLQLSDTTAQGLTQPLTPTERFRMLLSDPRFAVFAPDGAYLGQRIPFSLEPLGRIGLGSAGGVSILAGGDCAERVWSVNASIQGGPDMWRGSNPPSFTRVELHKADTFHSQWCVAPLPGEPLMQSASVRPARNLFREPNDVPMVDNATAAVGNFTRARIEATFNVPRQEFELDAYENGDSLELAGRGLYGQHALFIPAESISRNGSDGLDLNRVDDVLVRFDYTSVAGLP
ncbi:MAG: hypothetical protein AB2A00_29720 [Myxococcota bacterium]